MDRLVSHNYPAGRECSLSLGLHALSLVSHRVLWDYSPQIRNVLFPDPQIQTRSKRSKKRKNRLVAQYYLLFRIKNLLDVHRFLDQSTLQLFTYMFLSVDCTKDLQTMHTQQPSSLLFVKWKIRRNYSLHCV